MLTELPNLSANELLAVKTVADYGSFNAAAITLNVSQPGLTRTVQRVERQLGLTLFNRTTRTVEITEAGKDFVAFSERILNDMQIFFQTLQERDGDLRGQVVISAVMSIVSTMLPTIVSRYHQAYPGVTLHLHEGVHGTVLESVRSGVADFGLTYLDGIAPIFSARPLATQYFHVLLPKGHPLESRKQVPWSSIEKESLVSLPSDSRTRRLIDATAVTTGLKLTHAVTVTQFTTMMQFVASGIGIAIVPEGALSVDMKNAGLTARPLANPRVSRTLGLITLKEKKVSFFADKMIEQISGRWATKQSRRR